MARVRVSPAAREDLRDIRIYSKAAFGACVASAYMDGLRGVFRLLRDRPLAGTSASALGETLRSFGYRSHRVYYRPDDEGVLIVRILHHARDVGTVHKQ